MQGKNQNIKGFGGFTAAIARLFCGCEKHKSGFTLIEVLVVVLIIGILTSVALPQYEKAVEKSRAAKEVQTLKAIWDAQKVYYDTYGTYADNIEKLDVKVAISPEYFINHSSSSRFTIQRYPPYRYTLNLIYEEGGTCWAYEDTKNDVAVCKSLGGRPGDISLWNGVDSRHYFLWEE